MSWIRPGRPALAAGLPLLLATTAALFAPARPASAATQTSSQASASTQIVCGPTAPPATVDYGVEVTPPGTIKIASVTITHLPAACDGGSAQLQLLGNSAGNPAVPISDDTLLATVDSALDPCTGVARTNSLLISEEQITFPLCPTVSATAGMIDIGKLTAVSLTVNGVAISASLGQPSASTPTTAVPATVAPAKTGALAFTGMDIVLAIAVGLLALLTGLLLVLVVRTRRSASSS